MSDLTSVAEWMEQNGFHLWRGYQIDKTTTEYLSLWVYGPSLVDADVEKLGRLALAPWTYRPADHGNLTPSSAITEFLTDEGVRFSVELAGAGDRVLKYLKLEMEAN